MIGEQPIANTTAGGMEAGAEQRPEEHAGQGGGRLPLRLARHAEREGGASSS